MTCSRCAEEQDRACNVNVDVTVTVCADFSHDKAGYEKNRGPG